MRLEPKKFGYFAARFLTVGFLSSEKSIICSFLKSFSSSFAPDYNVISSFARGKSFRSQWVLLTADSSDAP